MLRVRVSVDRTQAREPWVHQSCCSYGRLMPAELPDEAIVVRGGQLLPDKLLNRARRTRREDGMYVLSVWCGVQDTNEHIDVVLERLVEAAPIPHGELNLTTAGALREACFGLTSAPPPTCHFHVELGTMLSPDDINRFVESFTKTRRNQWRRRE